MAECHGALKDLKNSIHAYYQVLALEPLQIAVRFKLSVLLRASGREDEALSLLAGEKFIWWSAVLSSITKYKKEKGNLLIAWKLYYQLRDINNNQEMTFSAADWKNNF